MRYAAFLRGINLGRRRVTGGELESAFRSAGCDNPASYQAAGNIVFDDGRSGADLATHLESVLENELGFEVRVILRDAAQVRRLAAAAPFGDDELDGAGKVQAILVQEMPATAVSQDVTNLAPRGEILRWGDGVLWWLPDAGVSDSDIDMTAIERIIGLNTMRTKGTIERLAKKYLAGND